MLLSELLDTRKNQEDDFTFDLERMKKCVASPKIEVPPGVSADPEAFNRWLDSLRDTL